MLDSTFISYVTVMSITPGPNNLLLAAAGVNFGLRKTLPMMLGITLGCALQCLMITLLLAWVLNWVGLIRLPMALGGCAYLLWISWRLCLAASPRAQAAQRPMSFFQGILFQGVNPKAWLMTLNIAILFTPAQGATLQHVIPIVGGFILLNLPCIGLWALMGDRLRHALQIDWKRRLFNGGMAGMMALTALWLLFDEWQLATQQAL